MVRETDIAEMNLHKAVSVKNGQISMVTVCFIATVTVLMPITARNELDSTSLLLIWGLLISFFIIGPAYLSLKHTEYRVAYIMFLSVSYAKDRGYNLKGIANAGILRIATEIDKELPSA